MVTPSLMMIVAHFSMVKVLSMVNDEVTRCGLCAAVHASGAVIFMVCAVPAPPASAQVPPVAMAFAAGPDAPVVPVPPLVPMAGLGIGAGVGAAQADKIKTGQKIWCDMTRPYPATSLAGCSWR